MNFENEMKKAFYRDETEAEQLARSRARRAVGMAGEADPDDFVE